MNEIRHNIEKLMTDFFFGEINEEDFEKEFDKLNEQQDENKTRNKLLRGCKIERI